MQVPRCISGVSTSTSYDQISNQPRDLPSLSEVFSRIRQSSVFVSVPSLDRSALAFIVSGTSCNRGCDFGFSGRGLAVILVVVTLVLVLMGVAC